jgi:ribosomal protein S12 methylthiotransferase accessory factor
MIDAALTPALRRAVSPYTGIVGAVEECLAPATEPRLFRATCTLNASDELLGTPLVHCGGVGGADVTRAGAAAAAVGEALERYSASFVPHQRLVVATAHELGDTAVAPERFALFAEAQYAAPAFPFRRFTARTRVAWVEGRQLPRGAPAWLPAELVFLGDATLGSRPIGYATSSGAACGETRDETIERGLCELLERDAFMITWAARLSLPLLDWGGLPTLVQLERRFFAPAGLGYAAVDLSCFHRLPSVLGVVRAPAGLPGALGVGAGTGRTIERAWFKALAEAFSARSAGAKLALVERSDLGPHGGRVRTFEDHIRYYAHGGSGAAAFLDAGRESTRATAVAPLGEPAVDELCARVAAAGSSAYVVDVTSPDVAELGLVVTKVVAPELCPLEASHAVRFLGGRRLYETVAALGLRPGPLAPPDVNPDPHPFP